jgi:hypothetical protein
VTGEKLSLTSTQKLFTQKRSDDDGDDNRCLMPFSEFNSRPTSPNFTTVNEEADWHRLSSFKRLRQY